MAHWVTNLGCEYWKYQWCCDWTRENKFSAKWGGNKLSTALQVKNLNEVQIKTIEHWYNGPLPL